MKVGALMLLIFVAKSASAQQPAAGTQLTQAQNLHKRGAYANAEKLFQQVLAIEDASLDEQHLAARQGLALVYQATGRRQEAFQQYAWAMSDEQALMTRRLERGDPSTGRQQTLTHEDQLRAFSVRSRESLEVAISMAAEDLKLPETTAARGVTANYDYAAIKKHALAWTLLRKGIVLDTLLRLRQSGAGDEQEAQSLRELRARLSDLALNPPQNLTPAQQAKLKDDLQREINVRQDIVNLGNMTRPQNGAMVDAALQVGDMFRFSGETELDKMDQYTAIPAGSALVEFLRARVYDFHAIAPKPAWKPAHYYAFVRTAGRARPVEMFDLGDAATIDAAIQKVRRNIISFTAAYVRDQATVEFEKQKEAEFRDAGGKLYDLVFGPLRQSLGTAKMIYLAPDSELNRVSFEALAYRRPDGKPAWLVEDYRFAYLSSGRDTIAQPAPRGRGTVVFADPDYDLGVARREELTSRLRDRTRGSLATFANDTVSYQPWPPLHASTKEASLVQQELTGTRYGPVATWLGDQALQERLLALRSPRILHIATHGFFLPDAPSGTQTKTAMEDPLLRSGILLAGANTLGKESRAAGRKAASGWVTAEDIMAMDLRDTELVVLSGCDTGLGDIQTGEGVFGLRRAFLYGGARNLLVSLYKVPDEETIELMSRFYEAMKSGTAVLDSFHNAQLTVLRSKIARTGAAHPFYWSSFVLVGAARYTAEGR